MLPDQIARGMTLLDSPFARSGKRCARPCGADPGRIDP